MGRQIIRIGVRGGKITGESARSGRTVLQYGSGRMGASAGGGHGGPASGSGDPLHDMQAAQKDARVPPAYTPHTTPDGSQLIVKVTGVYVRHGDQKHVVGSLLDAAKIIQPDVQPEGALKVLGMDQPWKPAAGASDLRTFPIRAGDKDLEYMVRKMAPGVQVGPWKPIDGEVGLPDGSVVPKRAAALSDGRVAYLDESAWQGDKTPKMATLIIAPADKAPAVPASAAAKPPAPATPKPKVPEKPKSKPVLTDDEKYEAAEPAMADMRAHRTLLLERFGMPAAKVQAHCAAVAELAVHVGNVTTLPPTAGRRAQVAAALAADGDAIGAYSWLADALKGVPENALPPDSVAALEPVREDVDRVMAGIRKYALARVGEVRAAGRAFGLACLEADHPKVAAACKAGDELWLRNLELGEGMIRAFDTDTAISYRVRKGGNRAYYRKSGTHGHLVKMGADYEPSGGGTLRHELSHAVEQAAPEIGKAAEAWRDDFARKTNGGKLELEPLSKYDPNYGPDEVAYAGAFFTPYVARKYPFPGSEVLSMGMEFVYMAPDKKQAAHFQHFALVDWAVERALAAHKAAGRIASYTDTPPAAA